jgi:hypothetical protein
MMEMDERMATPASNKRKANSNLYSGSLAYRLPFGAGNLVPRPLASAVQSSEFMRGGSIAVREIDKLSTRGSGLSRARSPALAF